jgi:hypothetical protein
LNKLQIDFGNLRAREKKAEAEGYITEVHEILDEFEEIDARLQILKADPTIASRAYFVNNQQKE